MALRWGVNLLIERFQQERLAQTAGSLTFTTTMAMVPCLTVILALFTAFPVFNQFQTILQHWFVESLIPESISRPVLNYLTQFSSKASRLGIFGFVALFFSAFALVFTIDRALNAIWRVKKPRSWAQRVLLYWSALTLGPMVLCAAVVSLYYLAMLPQTLLPQAREVIEVVLGFFEFAVCALSMAALYRFVPKASVPLSHALIAGAGVTIILELARHGVTWYLSKIPTVSLVYGTFATLPILLLWIYLAWCIVLAGAVVVASIPSLTQHPRRSSSAPGWEWAIAIDVLQALVRAQPNSPRGLNLISLSNSLSIDVLELESVLERLQTLDWVGELNEPTQLYARYVLLIDPNQTPVLPLVRAMLLDAQHTNSALEERMSTLNLSKLLQTHNL
jgi:membrane protein